ncbi:DUF1972 domain-containing protein [Arthrobacter sp. NIO-1057]|uniref:DUF1972 domain-containing protein n=1 Tax=Arthrobacter sp. NIO-1057 TaxID=993071 RepID=UPI00071D7017|nr:DUF1972 domain-containing protein [Arthrobacter sp. NIO-1057]KSU67680.1 glycosyl transferase [Arthrobacter sp. NIO-1057]SCB75732.1 Glycosyltransferase involved in cell wall bisynthesis [Arthrobacter sp. NIO-1057]
MQRTGHNDSRAKLSIALVGTRGVPARYGGFETAIEEVGCRLAEQGHDVTVYCRGTAKDERLSEYLGMKLVHLPAMRRRSLETLSHTALSVVHAVLKRPDVAIVFNAANAPTLPLLGLGRIPFATHVDGLEWKRAKWGPVGQKYYRLCERLCVWWSKELIADARGIANYYTSKFSRATRLIAYGAPQIPEAPASKLATLGLESGKFHLMVARFEPENHVELIVRGYSQSQAKLPLVVVGSAPYAEQYTQQVHAAATEQVRFLGGVWDQELLDELYAHALAYWHGHSVGGTNPSLLRALGAGTAINAFDVNFNREVAQAAGEYFTDAESAAQLFDSTESQTATVNHRAQLARMRAKDYDWDEVAKAYENLCMDLAGVRMTSKEFEAEPTVESGRRRA